MHFVIRNLDRRFVWRSGLNIGDVSKIWRNFVYGFEEKENARTLLFDVNIKRNRILIYLKTNDVEWI